MWKQFARGIMDYKADLISFLQTAAGWSVSGDTSEQSMFIFYGTRANGKSTFLNVIQNILGDYALSTWSEYLIKQVTGNDALTVRFLYGEYFNFVPNFKIFMASNHKPVIRGTDHGIWRRIKLIPFTTRITEDKRDRYLEQKLLAEKSGILNWLIEGALRWKQEGLNVPTLITNATDEYRREMDVIGNFLRERCVQKPGEAVRAQELFQVY
jgi:putative DNA primase/helicase